MREWIALSVVLVVAGLAMLGAALRTSTTFDEITMVALGARGYETGRFDLMPQHPPGAQYVYGLPVYLSNPAYPDEALATVSERYEYAQDLYWARNDPERIALLSRLPAIFTALGISVLSFVIARRLAGPGAGLLAAVLVAFLPDVLAHGAVAYSDILLAFWFLASVWTLDLWIRNPRPWRGALAGVACALALGVKFSAVLLAPVSVLLVLMEAAGRNPGENWHRELRRSAILALLAMYTALVVMYRGDFLLIEMLAGLHFTFGHVTQGHDHPAFLLGSKNILGWWYFYPVTFLLKTPAALHLLLVGMLLGFRPRPVAWKSLTASPLRGIVVGTLVFAAALLGSNLNIGFRYALPMLPLLCILVATGTARLLSRPSRFVRALVTMMVGWYVVSSLSFYPHFLAYTSEYIPDADRGYEALVDSNLDWGQGLLELRSWMEENEVERVYLSYFGSAIPAGYGIDYEPLDSFLVLDVPPAGREEPPEYVVISATNLQGVYLPEDPFAAYRERNPVAVIAHTLFVYDAD